MDKTQHHIANMRDRSTNCVIDDRRPLFPQLVPQCAATASASRRHSHRHPLQGCTQGCLCKATRQPRRAEGPNGLLSRRCSAAPQGCAGLVWGAEDEGLERLACPAGLLHKAPAASCCSEPSGTLHQQDREGVPGDGPRAHQGQGRPGTTARHRLQGGSPPCRGQQAREGVPGGCPRAHQSTPGLRGATGSRGGWPPV